MKIAIISDIHGNLEALKSVLDDIKKRNINKIYCLGDIIAKGDHLQECVDLVRENCEIVIKGNCDEAFSHKEDLTGKSQNSIDRYYYNRNKLTEESINYLSNLPYCYEFYLSGRLVRLLHAHPEGMNKFVGNIDNYEKFYNLVLPSENTISNEKADILIYGHIHVPYIQKIYNRYIINTGSLGNALDVFRNDERDGNLMNTTLANYLILSGNLDSRNLNDSFSFELVSVPYDIDKELLDSRNNIDFKELEKELKEGRYRDVDKLNRTFEDRGIDKDKI